MTQVKADSLFEIEKVSYQINGHQILKNLSFKISHTNITGIIGSSGSGKSTLLHLLNKLLSPTQGRILFQNQDISNVPSRQLRKRIGLVQQNPFLFNGSILENIVYGPKIWGEQLTEKRIEDLLNGVELPKSLVNKDISQLSGGEQQRVSLIRTLANNPEVLLLDEPTSSLDIKTEDTIEKLLLNLSKQGISILIVTHSLEQAKRLTDQVIVLKEGLLEQKISTNTFFQEYDDETIQKMFTKEGWEEL
ncbi:MAG: ABC transporter ATP-binding protein [Candidatus Hodarchaeales archaeon]